jgi:hypothetical protein
MAQSDYTSMYDLLKAIEEVISSADPETRNTLAATFDKYMEDNPQEFFWVIGPQAPALLHHIMLVIDLACRPDAERRQRSHIVRLIHRKPQGHH